MSEFAEKARTIGVSLRRGTANRKPVIRDDDGTIGGYEIEHWDDHQDAEVHARPVRASLAVNEEE